MVRRLTAEVQCCAVEIAMVLEPGCVLNVI